MKGRKKQPAQAYKTMQGRKATCWDQVNFIGFKKWQKSVWEQEAVCLMEEEIFDSQMREKIIDRWHACGEELRLRLIKRGIPICTKYLDNKPGINILKVCYKKNGEIKTKWVEDKFNSLKKEIISWCRWTFLPCSILPRKQSVQPRNLYFDYIVSVESQDSKMEKKIYCEEIKTNKNGTLLKRRNIKYECGTSSKLKFAFPKQIVARMNQCLLNNFLKNYWDGPSYAAWCRTDEGHAYYLGTKNGSLQKPDTSLLSNLLNGPAGNAVLILMTFASFSILKPFFPTFPVLQKNSPYLKAKKYIPEQIAINIQSSNEFIASNLVTICCGEFKSLSFWQNSPRGRQIQIPVIDGITIQSAKKPFATLNRDEFEATVLQPASILWVNRKPTEQLVRNGLLLDLQVPSDCDIIKNFDFSAYLIHVLANEISTKMHNMFIKAYQEEEEESKKILEDFLVKVKKCVEYRNLSSERFKFYDKINNTLEELKGTELGQSKYVLQIIKCKIFSEIENLLIVVTNNVYRVILSALRIDIEGYFEEAMRDIRRIQKEKTFKFMTLNSDYKETLKRLKNDTRTYGMEPSIVRKIAYLSTSFRIFVDADTVLSSKRDDLHAQAESVLISLFRDQIGSQTPEEILEEYILENLKEHRCARIRGVRSQCVDTCVWYDKRANVFFLRKQNYLNDLKMRYMIPPDFEKRLAESGALCEIQRGKQRRRSFEIVLQAGGKKESVVKVRADLFSKTFTQQMSVLMDEVMADHSAYRALNTPTETVRSDQ